ncbi:hypothetical protein FT663_04051 [Candidozyma haemuli var. vulneris]|nr:hypothetical protein FT662_03507 [[Candida] haemuloni var. vulneris]KAF3988368.1 hypothetical protein FT663_04051 [[Candida] haemuloni var. vulneris]
MAGTLRPDPDLQRFNAAKEKMGHYFRFRPRSAFFNVIWMGVVPLSLTYLAYSYEGQLSFSRKFRKEVVLEEDYVPRKKDL